MYSPTGAYTLKYGKNTIGTHKEAQFAVEPGAHIKYLVVSFVITTSKGQGVDPVEMTQMAQDLVRWNGRNTRMTTSALRRRGVAATKAAFPANKLRTSTRKKGNMSSKVRHTPW